MRYVTAMYDAPFPALAALEALRAVGVAPGDTLVIPSPPDRATVDWGPPDGRPPSGPWLHALGLRDGAADAYAEGLRRGAILVVVRCPTASAPPLARILATAALDVGRALARWRQQPDLRYEWRDWGESASEPTQWRSAATRAPSHDAGPATTP